jgi:tetratricopeptide (TPR) repeat protein
MFERKQVLLLLLSTAAILGGQHSGHALVQPEKPVIGLQGLGSYSHRIATANPEAQRFFDQGLRLLYGFNRYEALRSFRRAAELDPRAPMPLWGMAMALGPHINMDMDGDYRAEESCRAVTQARTLVPERSLYERAYLEAVQSRCPAYETERYARAMQRLYEQYPDDLDAATLYAESLMVPVRWHWWLSDGSPAPGMAQAVSLLEGVMRRDPNHPGANHLYIHAVEMSPSPERAIPSAYRLMGLMPSAGHMVHMPAHIWLLLGEWETAATLNERAARADQQYFARTGVQSSYQGYYIHNLHFVAYARSMQGRSEDAIRAADQMATECASAVDTMAEMIDPYTSYPTLMRVRFRRWDDLLSLPAPHAKLLSSRVLWHWGRAIAHAQKGDRTSALREAEEFRQLSKEVPVERPWTNGRARDVLALSDAALAAYLATGEGEALEHWRLAVDLQDRLAYDEPPTWYMPVRESLGAALLRAGQAAEAEAVFREGARRSVRNGRMLYGLMKALEAEGKAEGTIFVREQYEREWKNADVKIRVEDL